MGKKGQVGLLPESGEEDAKRMTKKTGDHMGSERNHVAAEEVNTADNLLKANLHSSSHVLR